MQTIRPKTAPLFFTNKHLPSSFYNLKWFVFLFRYLHAFFFWYKIYPWNHIAGWLEIKHKLPFDFLQRTKLFQFCPLGHKTLFVDKTSSSVSLKIIWRIARWNSFFWTWLLDLRIINKYIFLSEESAVSCMIAIEL